MKKIKIRKDLKSSFNALTTGANLVGLGFTFLIFFLTRWLMAIMGKISVINITLLSTFWKNGLLEWEYLFSLFPPVSLDKWSFLILATASGGILIAFVVSQLVNKRNKELTLFNFLVIGLISFYPLWELGHWALLHYNLLQSYPG